MADIFILIVLVTTQQTQQTVVIGKSSTQINW